MFLLRVQIPCPHQWRSKMQFLKRTGANSLAQQAEQKAREGDLVEALNLAQKAFEADDKNALVLKTITKIYFGLGDPEAAVGYLRKYLEVAPEDAQAWSFLGSSLKEMGRYEEAEQAHKKAIETAPQDGGCWYNLAVLYEITNMQEAHSAYLKAIECDPNDQAAWYNLGNVRTHLGDHQGAITAVQRATELDPTDADAWDNLASFLSRQDRWQEAEKAARKAVEVAPHHPNARARLRDILRKLGQNDFEPVEKSKIETTNCGRHGHPEFVLYYENPPVDPAWAEWLVSYLEGTVAAGEKYKVGETIQIGWIMLKLFDEDGKLCLCEPDFRSPQINYEDKSVTHALEDMFTQQFVAGALGLEEELDWSNLHYGAIVCKRFGEVPMSFYMQRSEPQDEGDSGWFFGCMFDDCDHQNMVNLKLTTLYSCAVLNPPLVRFYALPEGCEIVRVSEADDVTFSRYGEPINFGSR